MSMINIFLVAYLPAYAALHSLLVSRQFKSLVWNIYGPDMDRWYLKFFSVFAAIALVPLVFLFISSPGRRLYIVPSPWRWLMVVGQIVAGIATVLAFTDAPHRFSISQQLGKAANPEPLRPRGIYCFVRDPFLLSGLLQMWLTPFMTTWLLVLYVMSSFYLFLGSLHWENRLYHQFGKEFEVYQRAVPRIIPRTKGLLRRL
jgi:protein-S-isoprenylcysteine O-methyltransferase Ste14